MSVSHWTDADSQRSREIWAEYERRNYVADRTGQTAGIDPVTGRVWLGDSIQDFVAQRNAVGSSAPLYFVRIGSEAYYRKGGRR